MKKNLYNLFTKSSTFRDKVLPYYLYYKRKRELQKEVLLNLQRQLQFADKRTQISKPTGPKILIPYIETNHYVLYMMLILAKALQLRGAEVKFLYCNQTLEACERINVHNVRSNVCQDCRLMQEHLLPIFGLETCKLGDLITEEKIQTIKEEAVSVSNEWPNNYYYYGIDLVPIVDDSVLRFYYGGSPRSDAERDLIRAQHLGTAMISTEIAMELYNTFKPDIILSLMFVYSAFQPYFEYFKNESIPCISVDMTYEDPNAVHFSPMDLYFSNERFHAYLNSRQEKAMNAEESNHLFNFLEERFSGQSFFFESTGMFDAKREPTELLKLDPDKRNIFLFANVFWDVGLLHTNVVFDSMIDWVMSTIARIKDNDEYHLYIKPHPVEKFDTTPSLKSVRGYIHERYPTLPNNVTIIAPEMQINTYKMFPYIDIGVVYSGTLGLEMLLNDIPVIIAGKAPYSGLGLCYEPVNREEYFNMIIGNNKDKINTDKEMAFLFAYFYFIKRLVPFEIMRPVYGNHSFKKYNINSLEDLLPGNSYFLDHICDSILAGNCFECW